MKTFKISFLLLAFIAFFSCSKTGSKTDDKKITLIDKSEFEMVLDDKPVSLYTLDSDNGVIVQVTNYGGRIVSVWAPDRSGNYEDVVLGFGTINDCVNNYGEKYMGPVIGRFGNRIANGSFTIGEETYQLPQNDGTNCLHGGFNGFDTRVWDVTKVDERSITMSLLSEDGDEGFPGNLLVEMTYELTADNALIISYHANTDKPTHVNLTNHSQFNLKGVHGGDILDHILMVNSSFITAVDDILIPTGELELLDDNPLDFRVPTVIGERINEDNDQLKKGQGYDHNWVLDRKTDKEVELAATLYEPQSGRFLEVFTDQPGIQIYTGNFFDGTVIGKYNQPFMYRGAIAMETQKYPDTPNQPKFPSTLLKPGEVYKHTCIYKFSVK